MCIINDGGDGTWGAWGYVDFSTFVHLDAFSIKLKMRVNRHKYLPSNYKIPK